MRYVGILLVIASFPLFLALLQSGAKAQRWAFVALGALPILGIALNIDASLINWVGWPGHAKGLIVSLTDTLALAICVKYAKTVSKTPFLWVWICFILLSLPGLLVGKLFTPALFFFFFLLKSTVYFYACYIAICRGGFKDLINGLAITIIANGLVTFQNSLQGQIQTSGLIGHRNFAGLICNMAIPVLLVAGTYRRMQALPLLAVLLSVAAAIMGGSRAVIILLGVTIFLTVFLAVLVRPSKNLKMITAVCLIGLMVTAPVAVHKFNERFERTGDSFTLEKDSEREAFERAARMMNEDYPLGLGWSQFAVTMNAQDYAERAGVAWTTIARTATVHNSYLLMRTEGGPFGYLGLLLMLASTLWASGKYALRRRANPARVFAIPVFVTTLVLAVHIQFEWAFVAMNTLYSFALITSLGAYVREAARAEAAQQSHSRRLKAQQQTLASTGPEEAEIWQGRAADAKQV